MHTKLNDVSAHIDLIHANLVQRTGWCETLHWHSWVLGQGLGVHSLIFLLYCGAVFVNTWKYLPKKFIFDLPKFPAGAAPPALVIDGYGGPSVPLISI